MKLFRWFGRHKEDGDIKPENENSDSTEFKPAFEDTSLRFPTALPAQSPSNTDMQLMLAKLELINQRLEVMDRRLQIIEEAARESK